MAQASARVLSFAQNGVNVDWSLEVAYTGTDVPGGVDLTNIVVTILAGDSLNQLATKVTDAMVNYPASAGFTFTVARSACWLPDYRKGL